MAWGDALFARSSGGFEGKTTPRPAYYTYLGSTHSLLLLLWHPDTVVTAASQTSGGRTVSVEVHTLAEPGYGCERGKKKAGIRKQNHGCRNKARNTFPTTTIYLALAGSGTIRSVFESVIILLHSSSASIVAPSHACLQQCRDLGHTTNP